MAVIVVTVSFDYIFPPPLLYLVDNQLAKVDSKLEQILPGVTSFSDPFVHI